MQVILTSVGTDGDILPYVGLGVRLRERGHQSILVAAAPYRGLADRHGLGFEELVSAEENRELFDHPDFWNPLKTARLSARWGLRFLRRNYQTLASRLGPDSVMVANPGILAAAMVSERHQVPWASMVLQPWMLPSSISPPVMPGLRPMRPAPTLFWKAFWWGLDRMGDRLIGRELNEMRTSLGLRPVRRLFREWFSPSLILGMFPPWFGPPPEDWPPNVQLTGFPIFDGGTGSGVKAELAEFLDAGPAPVAFTFGTGMRHSAARFRIALEGVTQAGMRAVFLTRHRDQLPEFLPPTAIHVDFAPFTRLFPRCAAVVHHGGVGTAAQAFAAGVPQLIQPICFDQEDNGWRVESLGAGLLLPSRARSPRLLADRLRQLSQPHFRSRCLELSSRMSGLDPLDEAVRSLELLSSRETPLVG